MPGIIPGKDELRAKISQLHERVEKKEDGLLEKRLILEEIASLSDRLRYQAADGRQDTLELAQKVRLRPSNLHLLITMEWFGHVTLICMRITKGWFLAHLLKQHVDMLCIPCNLGAFIGSVIEIQYIRFDAIIHWGLTSPVMLCTSACACAKSNVHAVLG